MKYLALAGLGLLTFAATMSAQPDEANAVVCARGVYRAGCAGPRGQPSCAGRRYAASSSSTACA